MTDRPILFSGQMVRAILDGRKTVTRRPACYSPILGEPEYWCGNLRRLTGCELRRLTGIVHRHCPFGIPGDRLWVRETWSLATGRDGDDGAVVRYRDMALRSVVVPGITSKYGPMRSYSERWRPSIHMPRWASRITLEVTSADAERLQDITDIDAVREGVPERYLDDPTSRQMFAELWDGIYAGKGLGWDANPWVWRVAFRRSHEQ